MNTKELLKNMTLTKRYETIQQYRQGAFKVLNPALPQLVRTDILLSTSSLEVLKEIEAVIKQDVKSLKIEDIKLEDILKRNYQNELSELINTTVCLWLMPSIQSDYNACIKAEKLEQVYPIEQRKRELDQLEKEIDTIEESIEVLKSIDVNLVQAQVDRVEQLRNQREAIKRTLSYKTKEEIKLELYGCTHRYLETILGGVQANINHLERNMV